MQVGIFPAVEHDAVFIELSVANLDPGLDFEHLRRVQFGHRVLLLLRDHDFDVHKMHQRVLLVGEYLRHELSVSAVSG